MLTYCEEHVAPWNPLVAHGAFLVDESIDYPRLKNPLLIADQFLSPLINDELCNPKCCTFNITCLN